MIYTAKWLQGQALIEADSIEQARKYMQREYGTANGPYDVTQATQDDIAWVQGMGGMTHQA